MTMKDDITPGYWRVEGFPDDHQQFWLVKEHRDQLVNSGEPYVCAWGLSYWGRDGIPESWGYRTFGNLLVILLGQHPDARWFPDHDRRAEMAEPPENCDPLAALLSAAESYGDGFCAEGTERRAHNLRCRAVEWVCAGARRPVLPGNEAKIADSRWFKDAYRGRSMDDALPAEPPEDCVDVTVWVRCQKFTGTDPLGHAIVVSGRWIPGWPAEGSPFDVTPSDTAILRCTIRVPRKYLEPPEPVELPAVVAIEVSE